MNDKCPICQSPATEEQYSGGADMYIIDCLRCGRYHITRTAKVNVKHKLGDRKDQVATITSWIRENQDVEFDSRSWDKLLPITPPSVGGKASKLLKCLSEMHPYPGMEITLGPVWEGKKVLNAIERDTFSSLPKEVQSIAQEVLYLISISWSYDTDELLYILNNYLHEEVGFLDLERNSSGMHVTITPRGWAHLESLRYSNIDSHLAFIAMWFEDEVKPLYDDAIAPAVKDAGFEPLRIDQKDFINRIDDEIIASIRQSRFVIADYTGKRGGVYFESGFALGLGLPVIYLCQIDGFDDGIHFDVEHYPFLLWELDKFEELRKKLTQRIIATVGPGPLSTEGG